MQMTTETSSAMKQLLLVLFIAIKMVELCFNFFVHFNFVSIYISGFHHRQCASDSKNFTFLKFICQMCSSANEFLKDKTCLQLVRNGPIVTLHILCSFI